MIYTSIDEISFVFIPKEILSLEDWEDFSKEIVPFLIHKLKLDVVGKFQESPKGFAGYDKVLIPESNGMLLLAYNQLMPNMGVYLKFSAGALRQYLKARKLSIPQYQIYNLVHDFYSMTNYFSGECRVSKIDVCVDFVDEDILVSSIYKSLVDGKLELRNVSGRKNTSQYSAVLQNNEVQTIYIGSKKSKSLALLRIYDKKHEQIEKKGDFLNLALKCNNFTRLEASYRKGYAMQIGIDMQNVNDNESLSRFIFHYFCEKYQFYNGKKITVMSKYMLSMSKSDFSSLVTETTSGSDLECTTRYLIENSGLASYIYRINAIYGPEAFDDFLKLLQHYIEYDYRPNDDVIAFLNSKTELLRNEYSKTKNYPWKPLKYYFDQKED